MYKKYLLIIFIHFILWIFLWSDLIFYPKNTVFIKLFDSAKIPFHATEYSAGYDIFSNENTIISPYENKLIMSGIFCEVINKNYYIEIVGRSSLNKKSIITFNSILDNDFRGELGILLLNLSNITQQINKGDRIGQILLRRYELINFIKVDKLSETQRGINRFGSSGK